MSLNINNQAQDDEQQALLEWSIGLASLLSEAQVAKLLDISTPAFKALRKTKTPFCPKTIKLLALLQQSRDDGSNGTPKRKIVIGNYIWYIYSNGDIKWLPK